MKPIRVGAQVRIASWAVLNAALRRLADLRPEPGQMLCAGRRAEVTGYRRGAADRPLYELRDTPGLWREDWLEAI
jgi:hypothetical protein